MRRRTIPVSPSSRRPTPARRHRAGRAALRAAGALAAIAAASGSLGACSSLLGDFALSGPPADAGAGDDAPGDTGDATADAPPVTVHAAAAGVSVYLGQRAVLDASPSTTSAGALTFSWIVDAVPPDSAITTASLSAPSSAVTSFAPDVAGNYTLHVTVAAGGAQDSRSALVVAALPQVLFAQGATGGSRSDGGAQGSFGYVIGQLDGGGAHPVLCPDVLTSASTQGAPLAAFAGRAYDFWEAPPGQVSRFAAFTVDAVPDAGLWGHLWAGTTSSTCASPPADLGTAPFGPGAPFGAEPRFKPDGSRFVVYDRQWHIVTYAADGTGAARVVATYSVPYPQAASILDPTGVSPSTGYVVEPPRVVWTASGLAWAQPTAGGWEIVTAADAANATLATYMTCSGVTPREIAMLSDGTVIASYRQTPSSPENLYQLKPDAQRNCTHQQQYTHLSPDAGESTATDFAVSPDEERIAFLQLDTATQDASPWLEGSSRLPGGYLYVVSVMGGTPAQVSADPALYGPEWIAGGTELVFTRLDGVATTGKPATTIIVLSPDGGAPQIVARGDGVGTFVSTSGNAACDVAGGSSGGAVAVWALPLFAALARRGARPRRRRA